MKATLLEALFSPSTHNSTLIRRAGALRLAMTEMRDVRGDNGPVVKKSPIKFVLKTNYFEISSELLRIVLILGVYDRHVNFQNYEE